MSTLYEYYNTGDDAGSSAYAGNWPAQTFTPATAHKITSVKLLLYRVGSPGTATVGIRATDGSGHPTGGDLCSGTTDGNTLTTAEAGEWREITLGAGYDLAAGTKYAIVVRISGGSSSIRVVWRRDSTGPTYAGGNSEFSTNSGGSWTTSTAWDYMFEEWGEPAATAKTSSDTGSGADVKADYPGVAHSRSETGSGADAKEGYPTASFVQEDTGSGVDAYIFMEQGADKSVVDVGSGIDAIITRLIEAFDAGAGLDAGSLFQDLFKNLFATELGWGSDSLTAKIEIPTKGGGMKLWT